MKTASHHCTNFWRVSQRSSAQVSSLPKSTLTTVPQSALLQSPKRRSACSPGRWLPFLLTLFLLSELNNLALAEWTAGFSNGFAVREQAVPGGVALVDIGPERLPDPMVKFEGKPVMVQKHEGRWIAVVGIPLSLKPGTHQLSVFSTIARKNPFRVFPTLYPTQRLTISDTSRVTPPASLQQKLAMEKQQMTQARESWRTDFSASQFQLPITGRFSSQFGLVRIYNQTRRGRHSGLDIAAPTGVAVHAAASGIVVESGEFHFNGNSVFIDHGLGLVSLYSHLSQIDVVTGQQVDAGELLGLVGETGRVTGPHLHWSVGLNGTWVNPLLFIKDGLP